MAPFVNQSNPNATKNNLIETYLKKEFKTVDFTKTLATNAGATTATINTSGVSNNVLQSFTCTISDKEGNEALIASDVAAIGTGVTASIANLNPDTDWLVRFDWSEPTTSEESPKFDSFSKVITGTKGSLSKSYAASTAGTLAMYVELWVNGVATVAKAAVADTGTAAFGASVPQDSTAYALLYFVNSATGDKPLKVISASDNGGNMDVSTNFADSPSYPLALAADSESVQTLRVDLDTSALGAIAASSVTIASNDPANASYVINFTATIV